MNLMILNGTEEGKQITLSAGSYKIGRSASNDIVLPNDQYVSGKHAELKLTETGKITIKDHGSRNGTFLLGEIVESQTKVTPGDVIRIGHTFIKVSRRSMERFFPTEDEAPGTPEAVAVVDIVGSSNIAQALGDRVASKVKNVLYNALNKNLEEFPAEFVKNTGDGYMLVFSNSTDAVKLSINLMNATMGDGSYRGFHIRIGINFGETIKLQDGDRRGMAVDMAFRIESVKIDSMHQTVVGIRKDDLPRVDRIFISEVVQRLIPTHSSIKTRCIGYFDLKGFTGRHKIFEVLY